MAMKDLDRASGSRNYKAVCVDVLSDSLALTCGKMPTISLFI